MDILRTIIMIVFIAICVILTITILMQEGKGGGLGALAGAGADSYWGKNKGRSMEGVLVKVTRILVALFLIIAAILCIARLA